MLQCRSTGKEQTRRRRVEEEGQVEQEVVQDRRDRLNDNGSIKSQ